MALKNNRNVYSLLNAFSAILLTLVNGLMGIIATRLILEHYGSDFNGLNSTANQVVHVLLIIEGGFTTASNVALFKPLVSGDYDTVNGILAATRKKFLKIGAIFFAVGTAVSVGFAMVANSSLDREFIATVIMMTMIPPAFNLFYATTYRVLLQTQQKEYVVSFTTTVTIGLGHLANIIMISKGGPMWMVRVNTMTFSLLSYVIIVAATRRKNKFLNLKVTPRPELIKGTGDVMAQRITSVIYDSSPLIFLAISPAGGTVLASVYAVYNNVFSILKSLMRGAIDAPRLSIGQLLAQRKRENVWSVFSQYQYAAFSIVFVLLTTTAAMIMPFVRLYTDGITDAAYLDSGIAVMMIMIVTAEMIHMPSSHILNMAGEFKICRNIQITTCAILLVSMSIGGTVWGLYGMLFSLLLVTLVLDLLEMIYVHTKFFKGKIFSLLRLLMPLLLVGAVVCYFEFRFLSAVSGYLQFALYGILFAAANALLAVVVGLVFNRKTTMSLFRRVLSMVKR